MNMHEVVPVIEARGVSAILGTVEVLRGVDLKVIPGESLAITGRSGSGKSTLLHVLAGLIAPSQGVILVEGTSLKELKLRQLTELRLNRVGFVFQFSELVPELTLQENVALPSLLAGVRRRKAMANAAMWLDRVGLTDRERSRTPPEVSGGQSQRAAIARALSRNPSVILADEPTGALDRSNAQAVMDILLEQVHSQSTALIIVTHDHDVARKMERVATLDDGVLTHDASGTCQSALVS